MCPQAVADQLRESIKAPAGAVTVWPWHEGDGTVTMIVVINPSAWVDDRNIPKKYQGHTVRVERREPPIVRMTA